MENEILLPLSSLKKNTAENYLNSLGYPRSMVTVANCIKNIALMLGQQDYSKADWSKLRRTHWLKVHNSLKSRGCSGATVNLYLTVFKAVAREAWSLDLLSQSVYLKIKNIKGVHYERLPKGRSLSLKECRLLLESCYNGTTKGYRDRAIFALMFGCGLRRAEIVSLKYEDWNCCERSFTFVGKGNKERKVFLPTDLNKVIDEWLYNRGLSEGVFFPRMRTGTNKTLFVFESMNPSSIYRILQQRCNDAGLGAVRPHDLRRTFATRMLEAGCDLFILQRSMGHSSVATTSRYDYRNEVSQEKFCRALRF